VRRVVWLTWPNGRCAPSGFLGPWNPQHMIRLQKHSIGRKGQVDESYDVQRSDRKAVLRKEATGADSSCAPH